MPRGCHRTRFRRATNRLNPIDGKQSFQGQYLECACLLSPLIGASALTEAILFGGLVPAVRSFS